MSQKVEIAIVTWLLVSLTQVPVISFRRPIRHSLLATANPGLVTAGHRQLETPRGSPALGVPGESWGSPYWLVRSVWPHMPRMAPQLAVTWLYLFLFFNPMAAHWFQWTQAFCCLRRLSGGAALILSLGRHWSVRKEPT